MNDPDTRYFGPRGRRFLADLARHNDKDWFQAHRDDYEQHVRQPFQRLLSDLQPALTAISPHFHADPRALGGSLYRIHRDIRYSHDKSPYKPWQGARLFHQRRRETPTPAFYLHWQPGESFIGAGIWHPEPPTLHRLRQFIFDNPASWRAAAHDPALRQDFTLHDGDKLIRPPRGFPVDFEFIEDLKHRNLVLWRSLDDATMTGPGLRPLIERDLQRLAPLVDYLCAGLDLEF
ncbi:MAG: DUF2461 domain-containing protein [Lysobacteraceae bacterium]